MFIYFKCHSTEQNCSLWSEVIKYSHSLYSRWKISLGSFSDFVFSPFRKTDATQPVHPPLPHPGPGGGPCEEDEAQGQGDKGAGAD